MSAPVPATALARGVLSALIRAGVTDVVLAPGSRNAPLAYAAYDAAGQGSLHLHTRIDERTAAFVALGLTRHGRRAAVVCTSGTAAAHLHPAVLEASHAGVPMLAVTADRPAAVRGTGANQTTDQVDLYGDAAEALDLDGAEDLDGLADRLRVAGRGGRPVHLNVQLAPPLTPSDRWVDVPPSAGHDPMPLIAEPGAVLARGPRTVVVAGDDAGPPARRLAEQGGWPLLAEPTSGARTGGHAIRTYRLLLEAGWAERVERVVVAGHPTLSRPVTELLTRRDVEVVSLRARGRWPARPFAVAAEHDALAVADGPASAAEERWLAAWRDADRATASRLDALLAREPDLDPWQVAGAVGGALAPGGLLVVGASNPVRDLDLMAVGWGVGERRMVSANRGLAGIDGTVSTAIGAALARQPRHHGVRALALMGDVTFLHDAGALVLGPQEPRPDLTVVVVNDDGGSIFATLEQGDPAHAESFERLFATPHGVDLASLCAATRTPHRRVATPDALARALASPAGGIEVVEAVVGRVGRRAGDQAIRALAEPPARGAAPSA